MSIVTFWNDDREQSGRTLTSVAIATKMAIERNYKILLISTSFADPTMKNCFFGKDKALKMFAGQAKNISVETGIEGLSKLILSNKISPNVITDYTRVVFKGRLEILCGAEGPECSSYIDDIQSHKRLEGSYVDLIQVANQYYDMVLVDLDKDLSSKVRDQILQISNLNVLIFSQKLQSLDRYKEIKNHKKEINSPKYLPVIGKYLKDTKYNLKNISKYIGEKREINVIPFNTLFYEYSQEAGVADLFLKLRTLKDTSDDNYMFMQNVSNLTEIIIKRLQELQMKMR